MEETTTQRVHLSEGNQMRRILASIVLLAGTLTVVGINVGLTPAAAAHCPAGSVDVVVSWGSGGLIQWPNDANHSQPTWFDTYSNIDGNGLDMTFGMTDPDSRNEDLTNDLIDRLNASGYPFGYDPPIYTMTDGVYGLGFFTIVMNSEYVDEYVNWSFTFNKPVYVPDFRVDDVDAVGIGAAPAEEPHDSFQDEVELYADRLGTAVGFDVTPLGAGAPVVTGPTSFAGLYQPNVNNNVSPNDAFGQVLLNTTEPVTTFSFDYSNGPDEALYEPSGTYPAPFPLDPAGDGHSNNHAIRIADFTVCTGILTIGDTVYVDYDGDGVEDPGEPGLAGVTVTLYDDLGQVVATTTTDANGNYAFEDILPWDGWNVEITPPAGYTNTGDLDGGNDGTTVVDTSAGVDRLDADFALQPPPASIAGSVYSDPNNDGSFNPADGDTAIEGVEILLTGTDLSGNPVSLSTFTDANGDYLFPDLIPGTYTVTEVQPTGYDDGIDTPGTLAVSAGNDTFTVALLPNDSSIDNDFYEIPNSSLAGTVYEDLNNNGVQDAGEVGIAGVEITLTGTDDGGNAVTYTTTTDANGDYLFDNLRAGDYTVTETQPAGYFDGTDTAGSVGGTAGDDVISAISLPQATDATDYDFGELPGSSISGAVYDDFGTPIAGVEIILTGTDIYGNPVSLTTTTAADGSYSFTGLAPGTYTVNETQPAAYADGPEVLGSEGGDDTVNDEMSGIVLGSGVDATGYDFIETTGSISGTVVDDFGNPIPDVEITLTGTDDLGNTYNVVTTTDANGDYIFEGLPAGDYTVTETQPTAYGDGGETAGSSGGDDTVDDVISAIPLGAGEDSIDNDFDEVTGSISGSVFEDLNNDAQFDAGEPGIGGVIITLTGTDAYGNAVNLVTTTDGNGNYTFDGLVGGTYTVTETQPAAYFDGQDDAGSEGGDAATVNDEISGIVLPGGVDAVEYDFGELELSTLAGTVYEDLNNNGIQDAGEPGIPGVEITLTGTDYLGDPVLSTITTDADGNYLFGSLLPGTYTVTETQPAGYADGLDATGSAGGTTTNDQTTDITLGAFTDAVDYDFGEIPPASISGTVVDDFGNPIPGVEITLTGTDDLGNPVTLTTTTDINGDYSFTDLRPSDATGYTVTETQPVEYGDGPETAGSSGGDTSVNDVISGIVLDPGEDSVDNDFEETTGSLAGTVFEDTNNDGIQDAGEVGIAGVEITLTGTDDLGNPVSLTTTTDADGNYVFDGLVAGTYTINETQPATHADGIDTAGSEGGDATTVDDEISGIVLGGGVDGTDYDFAEIGLSSISGTVFEDLNNDGIQDAGELGIAGVELTLTGTDDLGNPVSLTATTDADGNYIFDGLRPGDYTVTETQPATYLDGIDTAGSEGGDATTTNDVIASISLPAFTDAVDYDFAEIPPSSISGTVVDDFGNPIPNVEITLTGTDDLGNPVTLVATTDANGDYIFSDLRPSDSVGYTVTETQPTGYADGGETAGSEGGTVSDDVIAGIVLAPGTDSIDNDFDEVTGSLSGTVFEDLNNNGQVDAGEVGIAGVEVTLTGTDDLGNPVSLTTTTAADGTYTFDNLISGTYTVNETQPAGYADGIDDAGSAGGDATTVNDEISAIPLAPGEDAVEYDFGELALSSISGTVYEDLSNDGVQDAGELGIAGVEVTLTGTDDLGNPVSLTTTTDADGNYIFDGLRPGTYTVTEAQPATYLDGIDTAGSEGGDAVTVNDEISAIVLPAFTDAVDYDFGELPPSSISGTVVDDFGNPIPNVEITLTGTDDLGNPVTIVTTTDVNGDYIFPDLRPGDYTVTETQPAGYGDGGETAGTAGGVTTTDDVIATIILGAGVDSTGNDFDEITGSLAGTVYEDLNNNGIQDAGELGIAGVEVTLTGTDDLGNPVSLTTTTDADGNYLFDYLLSGDYTVTETQPAGYLDGIDTAGSEGGDTTTNDVISAVALDPGVDATDYDFGELLASSISGTVVDDFGNPIEGVEITLTGTDDLGNPVTLVTTTDVNGDYSFTDLRPGTYTVTETQPVGYGDGGETAGSTGGDDTVDDVISGIVLAPATDSIDNDFDEITGSISGTVFEDLNNNGQVDAGETGIGGVEVSLTGTDDLGNPVVITTATNADGTYTFDNLLSGTYTVNETQPAGYADGADDAGSAGGDATTVNDEISGIPLAPGEDAIEYDFGEIALSSISGTVFDDLNNDGVQDAGELGIAGVEITLTGTDDLGNPVSLTTTTDADGNYIFDGLRPGTYTVNETQPVDYLDGIDTVGSEGGDAVTVNDEISAIVLPAFTDAVDYDFAEIQPSSISGTVVDDFGNPIEGVEITLTGTDDLGNPVTLVTTTDVNGDYSFTDLRPGDYTVTETQPVGYGDGGETAGSAGGDDTVDDVISSIILTPGTDSIDNDFDETTGSIAGTVYEDLNNDGIHDAGEPGIAGVEVTLTGTDDLGNPVSLTTTTDADGNYLFDYLLSGDYTVTETQPAAYLDGIDTAGSEGGDTTTNDVISAIALDPGVDGTDYDFGELPASSISGTVVDDGAGGAGNPIEGVEITLTGTDDLGNPVTLVTTTDVNGDYSFTDLRPGTYTVTETQPVGYGDGGETAGSTGGDDTVDDVISGIVLPAATDSIDNDFDETTGSLSGTVFEDRDNDGEPDFGEAGIAGVEVTLTGTDDLGNPVSLTTTTDADGNYTFDYLLSGTYTINETQPATHVDGIDDAGSEGGDDTTVNDEISGIVLGGGVDGVDYDFGELTLSSISGTVFDDLNNDGVQDAGELGIAGVEVTLTGTDDLGNPVSLTTTTDADGNYIFDGLRPGTYTVNETQPVDYLDGIDTAGSEGGDDATVNDEISAIVLPAFTDAVDYDFAEIQPSSISGTVVDDFGDPIPNTEITLTGTDDLGNPVTLVTTTDVNGDYSFTDLRPGDYTVTETQPTGYGDGGETAGSAGGDDTVDDVISSIILTPGTDSIDNDFDEITGSLAGTVFDDLNNDGIQDPGEPGISGVLVTLTGVDDLGNLVTDIAITDADGNYLFDHLLSGDYTIDENQPAAYLDGIDTAGTAGGDATSVNDQISSIPLDPGEDGVDYDFGEIQPSSISGTVVDDFGNPIPNVEITLTGTDDLGNPVTIVTTTDANGDYAFTDLRPGTYTVTETQPVGYGDGGETAGSAGGDDTVDDVISGIVLVPGTDSVDNDFDETTASLSGTVFEDLNNDGQPDIGEAGIAGVEVTLTGTDDLGNPVSLTTTTDADGNYTFDYLISGTYTVAETQPAGYFDGIDDPGSEGGDASINDEITVYVPGGVDAVDYDFGELIPSSISGSVVDDFGNPIPNVEITLTGTDDLGNPVTIVTTTDINGDYIFDNLRPGTYTVTETQPVGYGDGGETAGTTGGDVTDDVIANIVLPSNTNSTGNDFDETTSSIAGTVFEDLNNDGQPDTGESGIEGVEITLTGTDDLGNPVSLTTTTLADGTYLFENLLSGTYTVTETQAVGYEDGKDDAGTAGGDATTVNDEISAIPLAPGVDETEYDFGEILLSSIAGTVFDDLNNDGIQDAGELGIAGVEVTLTGTDDLGNPISLTTTTDADGNYVFPDLRPSDATGYTVNETQPVDYNDGIDTAGSVGGDATTINDEISGIVLLPFVDATDYDFAELQPASISGTVVDDFGNPIPNVEITLTGTDDLGNPVTIVTTTDVDGNYIFDGLRPGDYTVTETQPTGYGDGGETAGTAGGDDSVDDVISGIILEPGTVSTGNDFDETTGAISGTVFNDYNNDGQPDLGEPGIEGVEITLTGTDDLGNPVSLTTTTDADGNYLFENLLSGDYTVTETQPADYFDGIDDPGTAGGDNSVNDEISSIPLAPGEPATEYDFGELVPSSISGSVVDDFGNPIEGVEITLTGTDDLGNPVTLVTTTDADGNYIFEDLRPGVYTVTETQPTGYGDGGETAGTTGGDTSTNDVIANIVLASNTDSTGNDFDETTSSISGTVFHDRDNDGVQVAPIGDPTVDEPGIEGVEITLTGTDDLGNPVTLVTTTDADGNYVFENLLSGTYTITETHPDPYLDGIDTAGTEGGDATTVNDEISGIVLGGGVDSTDNNFAELGNILTGTVWVDTNEDGILDPEEATRLEGVVIELYDADGNLLATTTTDENGNYAFPSFPAGDYTVVQLQPDAYGTTTPNTLDVTLPVGGLSDVDFGEDPASITGVVWEDLNSNGIENPNEPPVPGVTVNLVDAEGNIIATTTTDADGVYLFTDLPAGDYTVELVTPDGMVVTSPDAGGNDTLDSDFPYIFTWVDVTLAAGEDVSDIDAGIVEENLDLAVEITTPTKTAKVGDTVVYTVVGSNTGNAPVVGGTEIVVTIPSGLSIESVDSPDICPTGGGLLREGFGALTYPGCWEIVVDGQIVTAVWTGDVLPGEEIPPFTITTKVKDSGDLVVKATISAVDGSVETTYVNNDDQVAIIVPKPAVPTVLAFTGTNTGRAVSAGLLLLILGGAVLALDRRKRRLMV